MVHFIHTTCAHSELDAVQWPRLSRISGVLKTRARHQQRRPAALARTSALLRLVVGHGNLRAGTFPGGWAGSQRISNAQASGTTSPSPARCPISSDRRLILSDEHVVPRNRSFRSIVFSARDRNLLEGLLYVLEVYPVLLTNDDLDLISELLLRQAIATGPIPVPEGEFDFNALSDGACREYFRFAAANIRMLADHCMPRRVVTSQRDAFTNVEGMCIALRLLARPVALCRPRAHVPSSNWAAESDLQPCRGCAG